MIFDDFERRRLKGDGTTIFVRFGGAGPPLLLLHGYPQTHLIWHRVAPLLAERFTVICADLRGYGESPAPSDQLGHMAFSKRAMAADMVAAMAGLGFDRFAVAGHDRGGRVLHRMCLDHPERVIAASLLDIVPTRKLFDSTNRGLATDYYHWFFLIQAAPLPERLISLDPKGWIETKLDRGSATGLAAFPPAIVDGYIDAFCDPDVVHATCEDYRAAATIDLEHDRADATARIVCPLQVLWGAHAAMHRHFDVPATWREKASGPVESQLVDCGHYLPEEQPEATAAALSAFFTARGSE